MDLGKVISIEEITNFTCGNTGNTVGKNGSQLGMASMVGVLCGKEEYDGYEVKTEKHRFLILISNGQSCCESWGYFASNDDAKEFIGKILIEVTLTDKALNSKAVEESGYFEEAGGIQFVDFCFSDGSKLQFAVYNAHNGYYGHPILVAKDEDILCSDTL